MVAVNEKNDTAVELVLAVQRQELTRLGVGIDGIYKLDFDKIDPMAYAFLPRHIVDDKSEESVLLGKLYPQVLPYFQIIDLEGRYLVYRRKGKEEGLLGKYSIGVGGHVDVTDAFWQYAQPIYGTGVVSNHVSLHRRTHLQDIAHTGAARELKEEINLDYHPASMEFTRAIATFEDVTSIVHLGLPMDIHLDEFPAATNLPSDMEVRTQYNIKSNLRFEESEFPGVEWLTKDELKAKLKEEGVVFETWSRLLIEEM